MEQLHIKDCAVVQCCEALEDAVALVCEGVSQIGSAGNDVGDTIKAALNGAKDALDSKVVNAAQYVL